MNYIKEITDFGNGFFHNNQYTDEKIKENLNSQKLAYTVNGNEIIHYRPLIIRENKDVSLSSIVKNKLKGFYLRKIKLNIYICK